MQKELATVLKAKIASLPFIDFLAGMVQTVSVDMQDEAGIAKITKRFPVSYDTNQPNPDCFGGPERMLIPDTGRKCIIYFEDYGINPVEKKHDLYGYLASIRLICWMNRAMLVGSNYTDVSGRAMAMIIQKIAGRNPENIGIFTQLRTDVARIPPQEPALFSRYTYNEQDRQYLRPPFEFFGIDFACRFFVNPNCLNETQWNQEVCY